MNWQQFFFRSLSISEINRKLVANPIYNGSTIRIRVLNFYETVEMFSFAMWMNPYKIINRFKMHVFYSLYLNHI